MRISQQLQIKFVLKRDSSLQISYLRDANVLTTILGGGGGGEEPTVVP